MSSKARMRNIGAYIGALSSAVLDAIVQGGAKDGAEQDGAFVVVPDDAESCVVWLYGSYAKTAPATLTLTANVQDAASGGASPADLGTDLTAPYTATVIVSDTSTSGHFLIRIGNVNLVGARVELRTQYTLAYSAGGGETTNVTPFYVFGGGETIPMTQ